MDFAILVQGMMVLAAVGLFVASYYRFSNPPRPGLVRERRAPEVSTRGSTASPDTAETRRSPSL